jgi:hypothetical protein
VENGKLGFSGVFDDAIVGATIGRPHPQTYTHQKILG